MMVPGVRLHFGTIIDPPKVYMIVAMVHVRSVCTANSSEFEDRLYNRDNWSEFPRPPLTD